MRRPPAEAGSLIYDSESFLPIFSIDAGAAKREVVIVSPYMTKSRTAKMLPLFDGAMASGASVTVVTRPAEGYAAKDKLRAAQLIQWLRARQIRVVERPGIHQKMAIIDEHIVWYGSVSLLSYGNAEEGIMRLDSRAIAEELLGIVGGG